MLNALRKSAERRRTAAGLCACIVARARAPQFYAEFGVADTLDGRFDLVVLHAWMVLAWLGETGRRELSQGLVNALFIGFDEGLRDLGTGDMGLGRKMKKMADAFYGRIQAYDGAKDEEAMADAILRNVYRGNAGAADAACFLARYARSARSHLMQSNPDLGEIEFGPLPMFMEGGAQGRPA